MSFLLIVIIGVMLAVLVVLALGLINLVRAGGGEDEAASRRSNRLMTWRVALQGIAVGLLGLLMLMTGKGG